METWNELLSEGLNQFLGFGQAGEDGGSWLVDLGRWRGWGVAGPAFALRGWL